MLPGLGGTRTRSPRASDFSADEPVAVGLMVELRES